MQVNKPYMIYMDGYVYGNSEKLLTLLPALGSCCADFAGILQAEVPWFQVNFFLNMVISDIMAVKSWIS